MGWKCVQSSTGAAGEGNFPCRSKVAYLEVDRRRKILNIYSSGGKHAHIIYNGKYQSLWNVMGPEHDRVEKD